MPARPLLLFLLLGCQLIGYLAQTWTGYSSYNPSVKQVNSAATQVFLNLGVTATTSSVTDKVLLVVNINMASIAAGSLMYFTIFRDGVDLATTGHVIAEVGAASSTATEIQAATFSFMDTPGGTPGAKEYSVYGLNVGSLSYAGVVRHMGALLIPNSMATGQNTFYTLTTISTDQETNIPGLSTTIIPNTATDMVLVTATFSVNPSSYTVLRVSLFGNSGRLDNGALQTVSFQAGANRQVTILYLDNPGSNGVVTYTVKGTMVQGSGMTICDSNKDIAHINLLSVPVANTARRSSFAPLTVTSSTWMSIGLSVTVRPVATTDKVLITVSVNFQPSTAACQGAFTIFRDATNLGDAQTGLQLMIVPDPGSYAPVAMSFLDSPSIADTDVVYEAKALRVGSDAFVISANSMTRQIAAIVSNAVTASPTAAPIADPTAAPSAPPANIVQNTFVQTLSVTPLFVMSMSLTFTSSVNGVLPNIWDIRDSVTGNSLITLYRYSTFETSLYYNQVELSTDNTILPNSIGAGATSRTVYIFTMRDTDLKIESSSGFSVTVGIPTKVNTVGKTYNLFASAPSMTTAGGTFAAFSFTGTLVNFTRFLCDVFFRLVVAHVLTCNMYFVLLSADRSAKHTTLASTKSGADVTAQHTTFVPALAAAERTAKQAAL